MKCKYKYLLPDLLQQKLTQSDFNFITEHLKYCNECSRDYTMLIELFNNLKDEKQLEPDETYWINLPVKIRNRIELENINPITRYIPQLALTISIVVIFSVFIFKLFNSLISDKDINTRTELIGLLDSVNQSDLLDYEESLINISNEIDTENIDEFVIKNIILTNNEINEYYLDNVNINSLRDEEIKYLISYLNQKKF